MPKKKKSGDARGYFTTSTVRAPQAAADEGSLVACTIRVGLLAEGLVQLTVSPRARASECGADMAESCATAEAPAKPKERGGRRQRHAAQQGRREARAAAAADEGCAATDATEEVDSASTATQR